MQNQTSVDSLQATINKQAEQKLRKDLWDLYTSVKNNRLLGKHSGNNVPELMVVKPTASLLEVREIAGEQNEAIGSKFKAIKHSDVEIKDIPNVLYMYSQTCKMEVNSVSPYIKELFDYWFPFYIQEETKAFIERIDKIQEDVDYLNGSVANLECNQH